MSISPAIIGTGATELLRHSKATAGQVAIQASMAALSSAGLKASDIDGYVGCFEATNASAVHFEGIDEVSAQFMCTALGLRSARTIIDLPQTALAVGLLQAGYSAILAGEASRVLIVRAMVHDDNVAYSLNSQRHAGGEDQYVLPFGLGKGGGRQALWWRRYLHEYGLAEDALYPVIANARLNAQSNPRAFWRSAAVPSREKFLESRYIYAPLRLLDCDIPVTGAVAFVLAAGELARDAPETAAYVHGFATRRQSFNCQAKRFGAKASEVESWQLYDGFSVLLIDSIERLGLSDKGTGTHYMASIADGARSSFINSFGGSIGEGRMHGMGHLLAAAQSVATHKSTTLPAAGNLAAADIGMWDLGATVLFGREPRWLASTDL